MAALAAICAGGAWAQAVPAPEKANPAEREPGIELKLSPSLAPPPRGEAGTKLPIVVRAREVRGRPDLETIAEGDAEFRRGGMVLRADRLDYQQSTDVAHASGNVRVTKDGNVYTGPEVQLQVQRFEGYFLNPTYYFAKTAAGGRAERIDFLDDQRAVATGATYTSCPADGSGDPAWLLTTSRVNLDFATNEGVAENAVLRFYGVPILAAPSLSFPLTDERKSGWLPPSFNLDSKSGFEASIPYYWNIAPNRDATFTPSLSTRRGPGIGTEFRYLEESFRGEASLNLLPHDNVTGHSRYALNVNHESDLPQGAFVTFNLLRVSDNDYWKDFPRAVSNLSPRLLISDLKATQPLGDWTTYARVQRWQVLQTADPTTRIVGPYERLPQIGARYGGRVGGGFQIGFETELNRFGNPVDAVTAPRPLGLRLHAIGSVSRPFTSPGWTLTPKASFNAASYALDEAVGDVPRTASRVIPTLSLDSAWVLERDATWFGRAVRQTLEPRLLYVETPYSNQNQLPNFDSAQKDFNYESIFTENAFTGVDRVSDGSQLTAGVTTRLINPETGAESVRLGLVQRYLFHDQRVTLTPAGLPGTPITQRFSDLLLLGSTTLVPRWTLDGTVQYRPTTQEVQRAVIGARYSPGPFRTVSVAYRLARGLSEQVELGWQWPLYGPTPDESSASASTDDGGTTARGISGLGRGKSGSGCTGSWYAVGRVNYSTRDSRITDSIVGLEYDAGCWIGRIVAERLSTGLSDSTTRLLIQLELVGLSRLGSNPLQVLKDNIPGYRLLRDERSTAQPNPTYD